VNIGGEHFPYFGTIGVNPFGGFGTFGGSNNNPSLRNNNNNNLPPISLLGFGGGLEGGFNLPLGGNARGLDPNITALVNALTGANLEINYVKRKSNHMKSTEFEGTEAEDSNEWLE